VTICKVRLKILEHFWPNAIPDATNDSYTSQWKSKVQVDTVNR